MNVTEKDYRIWENKNFIVESTVNLSLWDEILISDFYKKLNKVLNEIYEQLGLDYNISKTLISISFSGDKKIMELNSCYRKKKSTTNVLSFPSNDKFKNTTISTRGRHDPCVGIRAVPIVEAMTACVLADHLMRNKAQCG